MKRRAIILATLFAVGVLVSALWFGPLNATFPLREAGATSDGSPSADEPSDEQSGEPPEPFAIAESPPYPKAVVEKTTYHFDRMAVRETRSHSFVLRNEGEAPLKVQVLKMTCKCTVGELDGNEVPPGESVDVQLTWEPKSPARVFRQTATINTNDPRRPSIEFTIDGTVVPKLVVTPSGEWDLGDISSNEATEFSGEIVSMLHKDFQITEVRSSHPLLSAETAPLKEDELAKYDKYEKALCGYKIRGKITPGMEQGGFRETLTFVTDIDDGYETDVFVTGNQPGPVRIIPSPGVSWNSRLRTVDLGRFSAREGTEAVLSMFIRGMDEKQFQALDVDCTSEPVQVEIEPDRNFRAAGRQRFRLTFTVPPGSPPGNHRGDSAVQVQIKTNHPDLPTMEFTLHYLSL